jgi:hypothetical protein
MELNMKRLFIIAALAGIGFLGPVQAQEMAKCDDATMMKVEKDVMAMTDPAMKDKMEMGMKELDMAKMAMKENKEKDCSMHLDAAMKASMGQ